MAMNEKEYNRTYFPNKAIKAYHKKLLAAVKTYETIAGRRKIVITTDVLIEIMERMKID